MATIVGWCIDRRNCRNFQRLVDEIIRSGEPQVVGV